MFGPRKIPENHPAFASLPVRMITLRHGRERMAVHVAGRLASGRLPVVCVPGYQRNMSDFGDFVGRFARIAGGDWPVVLVDLQGRGRSTDRARKKSDYGSPNDARDLADALAALAIERAVFLGQGYGGQVAMVLAAERPALVAGAVLVDSGPVTDSRGIVRLRHNLSYIEGLRGARHVRAGYLRMLAGDHPGASEARLEHLALRCHYFARRGRARPLYDPYLLAALKAFTLEDVLSAQWPFFDALGGFPLMMLRTQLTDQLRRETFDEMIRRRPDALAMHLSGQGSPALFDEAEEVEAVARFVMDVDRDAAAGRGRARSPKRALA